MLRNPVKASLANQFYNYALAAGVNIQPHFPCSVADSVLSAYVPTPAGDLNPSLEANDPLPEVSHWQV